MLGALLVILTLRPFASQVTESECMVLCHRSTMLLSGLSKEAFVQTLQL